MIRLTGIGNYRRVYVLASGPSLQEFRLPEQLTESDLVIVCNDAISRMGRDAHNAWVDHVVRTDCAKVVLTADRAYAQTGRVPVGVLGVWVRLGDEPLPGRRSEFQAWVPCTTGADHWNVSKWGDALDPIYVEHPAAWNLPDDRNSVGLTVGGGAGCAALNLAYIAYPKEAHLFGFDGGGKYEAMRPGLDRGASMLRDRRVKVYDAAGRL